MKFEFYNPYLFIPFVTWVIAQVIKFGISAGKGRLNFHLLYAPGGMPSAHSAAVVALAVGTLTIDGFKSPLFGLSAVFAGIVMYDSFGVRRSSGDQAVAINTILRNLADKKARTLETIRLKEMFGHKPSEVIVGGLLGLSVALIMTTSYWTKKVVLLTTSPLEWERVVYLILFSSFLLSSFAVSLVISKKRIKPTAAIRVLKRFLTLSFSLSGVLGLLWVLAQYQQIPVFGWRLWPLLELGLLGALYLTLWFSWWRYLPERYAQEIADRPDRATKSSKKRRRR